ncbi:hypothetical protein SLS60_002368 [Paraconiothyrium brasiliense]|uniref:Ankyrin repeat protein n=1 Tax=Paraconiothyrium brasiliense TaxID=300254 RepID=A0ABR3S2H5_9PLEO
MHIVHRIIATEGRQALAMASVNDDSLGDFTNDLSSDIAPLIALFGERMTVQYLSESTSYLDYFIFAMAPIGIITAIVSTIRLCGNAALRAFIGRSQEGEGTVEAELCTSTSRDVCELFTNGGVQRVLGRPSILELVYIEGDGTAPESAIDGNIGLHLSKNYFQDHTASETTHWKRVGKRSSGKGQPAFAPNPNISLNIGVKKQPTWVFWTIAVVGLILQMGVIVLAAVGVWILDWDLNEGKSSAKIYAPTMYITGSILLCIGMWSCAALIGQTTDEIRFKRNSERSPMRARLLWLQPGPQVIGDQTFDPYAYLENPEKDPLHVWTSSSKNPHPSFEVPTFLAILATLVGYVVQFIGLRGLKGWVSLTQLGITIVMSLLRGLLRIKRIGTESNALAKMPDLVAGHELDWITSEIVEQEGQEQFRWHITGQHAGAFTALKNQTNAPQAPVQVKSGHTPSARLERLFHVRLQLAHLTGNSSLRKLDDSQYQVWENQYVKVRETAGRVASAICKATAELVKSGGQRDIILCVEAASLFPTKTKITHQAQLLNVTLVSPDEFSTAGWRMDSAQLEAILGLWVWGMISDKRLLYENDDLTSRSDAELIQQARIVSAGEYNENWNTDVNIQDEMNLWLGRGAVTFREATLRRHDQESQGIATLFADKLGESLPTFAALEPSEMDEKYTLRKEEVHHNLQRFCGWSNVHPNPHGPTGIRIQYSEVTRGETSLLDLCAQELFTILLLSLAELLPWKKSPVFVETFGNLRLEHDSVNAFVHAFQEAELGTASDAMLCVVPALRQKLEPLDPNTLLSSVCKAADKYRREEEWDRAETLMQWACAHFGPYQKDGEKQQVTEHFRQSFVATAELYRWSLAHSVWKQNEKKASHRKNWGLDGIRNLMNKFESTGKRDSEIGKAISLYEEVSRKFREQKAISESAALVSLTDALEARDRAQALYFLCFVNEHAIRSSIRASRSLLPLAVRNDWPEVVNVLLELNADTNSTHVDKSSSGPIERTALSYCAELGLPSYVELLLDHQAAVDEPSGSQSQAPISQAAQSGHLNVMQLLLKTGRININKRDATGKSCLTHAAAEGHRNIVEVLLVHHADIEHRDDRSRTPLMWAAFRGRTDVVKLLIDRQANPDVKEEPNGQSILMLAAHGGRAEIVEMLLDRNAVLEYTTQSSPTALAIASEAGHESVVKLLLDKGANREARDDQSLTPLMHAVDRGYTNIMQLLLDRGAKINAVDFYGHTALYYAAAKGRTEYLRTLIMNGAELDRKNTSKLTPLWAAVREEHTEAAELLIDNGASTELSDSWQNTLLHIAVRDDRGGCAQLLIEKVMNLEATNNQGETALHIAATSRKSHCLELLIHKGAKLEAKTNRGETALHRAAYYNDETCTKLLIEMGANLEAKENSGDTALLVAIAFSRIECVRLLIEKGANLEAKSNDGSTALHLAAKKRELEIVKLLVGAGALVETVNNKGETPVALVKELLDGDGDKGSS